ncbi:membrane protein [Mycolicibacterium cyprinidarum]|uniref:Membrane protein n=1 Tax=Mycolicibacterium cyprinidarum TaxID=2860311 RepID=A0ABQ4VB62_9MYCO|nr:membrane protein [Mycolicibacterium sp. NGTWS0302]GJF15012.1 membrane protein [Mycolicibacterium sp. NGTWSNA01]
MQNEMIERPTARYGRQRLTPRKRRWIAIGLTALVLVAGIVIAAVAFVRFGAGNVKGELGAYRIVDDETVEVTASITRDDPSQPAVCIVRARSYDGSETGRRELLVPPSTAKTVQVRALVKTSRPSVVGDIYGCGSDVPAYLVGP